MSETTQTADVQIYLPDNGRDPGIAPPPNLKVTPKTIKVATRDGTRDDSFLEVTFGTPPRTIEVTELDLGQQWDLLEITGSANNLAWSNMALIAASVRTIDGVPVLQGNYTKARLRDTLRQLGVDGMKAAGLAIGGYRDQPAPAPTEEAHRAAVGN